MTEKWNLNTKTDWKKTATLACKLVGLWHCDKLFVTKLTFSWHPILLLGSWIIERLFSSDVGFPSVKVFDFLGELCLAFVLSCYYEVLTVTLAWTLYFIIVINISISIIIVIVIIILYRSIYIPGWLSLKMSSQDEVHTHRLMHYYYYYYYYYYY